MILILKSKKTLFISYSSLQQSVITIKVSHPTSCFAQQARQAVEKLPARRRSLSQKLRKQNILLTKPQLCNLKFKFPKQVRLGELGN